MIKYTAERSSNNVADNDNEKHDGDDIGAIPKKLQKKPYRSRSVLDGCCWHEQVGEWENDVSKYILQ